VHTTRALKDHTFGNWTRSFDIYDNRSYTSVAILGRSVVQTIRCSVLLGLPMCRGLCICLSVTTITQSVLQKGRTDRGAVWNRDLRGSKEPRAHENGHFWVIWSILGHTQTRSRSMLSTRAFQFGQKQFQFDSIRQSDKFAACTLIFKY